MSLPPSFFQLAIAGGKDLGFAAFQLVPGRDVAHRTAKANSIEVVDVPRHQAAMERTRVIMSVIFIIGVLYYRTIKFLASEDPALLKVG